MCGKEFSRVEARPGKPRRSNDLCHPLLLDTGNFYGRKLIRDGAAQSNLYNRRPGERHCPDCCQNFKYSGRQSLIVWGGIVGPQASELCQFPGSIKPVKRG